MTGRVLVAYASKYGTTGELAGIVAARLRERGLDVDLVAARDVRDVAPYGAVVVGSGVYASRWHRDGLDFLKRFGQELAQRPVWMFSSGPTGGGTPESDARARAILEAQPPAPGEAARRGYAIGVRRHATFGGRIVAGMGWIFDRWIPKSDWRDPEAVRTWADLVAADLIGTEARAPVA